MRQNLTGGVGSCGSSTTPELTELLDSVASPFKVAGLSPPTPTPVSDQTSKLVLLLLVLVLLDHTPGSET